ncbi:MAG: hypothetical protein IJN43_07325, partial [Ruminococcus sp.]|nr:hypothetical protein [Ruminococcus sp.]
MGKSEFIQHQIHSVRYKLYTLNPCISVTFVLFADSISMDRCPARGHTLIPEQPELDSISMDRCPASQLKQQAERCYTGFNQHGQVSCESIRVPLT